MTDPRLARGAFARLGLACAIVAAFTAFKSIGALADEPSPACGLTLASARAIAAAARDNDGATYAEYVGDRARSIVKLINAVPPVSEYVDDVVLVIASPDRIRVGLSHDGCVDHALLPPPDVWDALVREALGDPS